MAKIPPTANKPAAPANTTAPANPTAPASSAKPGTKDTAGAKADKKTKKKRIAHPLLYADVKDEETGLTEQRRVKLKAVPADFDPKVHKPLSRRDFEDESMWYELKAQACERQAAKFRQMATEEKASAGSGDKAKTKRLIALTKRIEELKKTLLAAGMDEASLNEMLSKATAAEPTDAK